MLRIFVISAWTSSPTFDVLYLKSHISREIENNNTSSANRKFEEQSGCRTLGLSLHRAKSSSVVEQATQRIALLRASLDLENVALFVCQDSCLLVSI